MVINKFEEKQSPSQNKTLYAAIAEAAETEMQRRLEHIDNENITVPKSLDKKMKALGLRPHRHSVLKRVAAVACIFVLLGASLCLVKPEAATAVKNVIWQIFGIDDTQEMVDINLQPAPAAAWSYYTLRHIPSGFTAGATHSEDSNKSTLRFDDSKGQYFEISIYAKNYNLSVNHEDSEKHESITIRTFPAMLITRDGVTSVVFADNKYLFLVESNLPESEIIRIAAGIEKF